MSNIKIKSNAQTIDKALKAIETINDSLSVIRLNVHRLNELEESKPAIDLFTPNTQYSLCVIVIQLHFKKIFDLTDDLKINHQLKLLRLSEDSIQIILGSNSLLLSLDDEKIVLDNRYYSIFTKEFNNFLESFQQDIEYFKNSLQ